MRRSILAVAFVLVTGNLAAQGPPMGPQRGRLLQGSQVDKAAVLDEVDRILNLEREIKKAQISLMVRIKNTLTAQQQAKLAEIRGRMGYAP